MSAVDAPREKLSRRLGATASHLSRETPLVQLVVLIAIFGYGALTLQGFSSLVSIKSMLLVASFIGLAGLGQTVLVLLGYLDLSIPGFITLGNVLVVILVAQDNWPFVAALAVIIAAAILMGSLSGLICHLFRVESIVVTLGMNFILIGAVDVAAKVITGSAPGWLTGFASVTASTAGVPVPPLIVLWLILAVIVGVVLRRTVIGRRIYLTGSNPKAAGLALVRTRRVVIAVFALSAVSASVTGVLLTGFSGSADTSIGSPYLFTSLTAIIVGGTSLVRARGDYWRTVIGAIMITVINTVLLAKGYSASEQQILFGLLILAVALIYGRETRLRDRV